MTPIEEITTDLNWRLGELAVLKTIPHRYQMLDSHIELLKSYLVPAIYALWEGFVVNTFEVLIKEINSQSISPDDIDVKIILYVTETDESLCLSNARTKIESKLDFVKKIKEVFENTVHIDPKVVTKSNVNFKVINELITSFNMRLLPSCYKSSLDKLLFFRNAIAHGNRAISVNDEEIGLFSQLVNDLMAEIVERVEETIINRSYLRDQ